jgi:hypothetical protein
MSPQVSRIPVPIVGEVHAHVDDTFDGMAPNGNIVGWNIYSPKFAPVRVISSAAVSAAAVSAARVQDADGGVGSRSENRDGNGSGISGNMLQLRDSDPHDFAKAERVFPRTEKDLVVKFEVHYHYTPLHCTCTALHLHCTAPALHCTCTALHYTITITTTPSHSQCHFSRLLPTVH